MVKIVFEIVFKMFVSVRTTRPVFPAAMELIIFSVSITWSSWLMFTNHMHSPPKSLKTRITLSLMKWSNSELYEHLESHENCNHKTYIIWAEWSWKRDSTMYSAFSLSPPPSILYNCPYWCHAENIMQLTYVRFISDEM